MVEKGHTPCMDNEEIDMFYLEYEHHNGPGCTTCKWSVCEHCHGIESIPDECEPYEYISHINDCDSLRQENEQLKEELTDAFHPEFGWVWREQSEYIELIKNHSDSLQEEWRIGYPRMICKIDHRHSVKNCVYTLDGFYDDNDYFRSHISTLGGDEVIGGNDYGPYLTPERAACIVALHNYAFRKLNDKR